MPGGAPTDTTRSTPAAADRATSPIDEVAAADPRRWITLAIVLTTVIISGLDATVLNVAIPTILRDFDTTLSQLQWVIAGYSLTFGALLIIGGRLNDIHGPRRMFAVGATLFGIGSLTAALSTGVAMLIAGEAVIEGIGAALMVPASLAIITRTFHGRERGTAFAMWAGVMGAAVAFGPALGGFLTTNYSWRWAFLINVAIVPFAILGVLLLTPRQFERGLREPLDVPGAILIASGMGLLVFAISQGSTYGWWRPIASFAVAGRTVWPATAAVSVVPVTFVLSVVLLVAFYRLERAKERRNAWPLFQFSTLRNLGFRYGLASLLFLAMGQSAFLLVLSVLLQDGRHLSAVDAGIWLIPAGVAIVIGSQLGGWLTRRVDTVVVVRVGLALEAVGLAITSMVIGPDVTLMALMPSYLLIGLGIGFAGSQVTNVILRDVPVEQAGAASGANSTARMLGNALGIAAVSAILGAFTIHYAVDNLRASSLPPAVRSAAIARIHSQGVSTRQAHAASPAVVAKVDAAVADAIGSASQDAMRYGALIVSLSVGISFLIPRRSAQQLDADELAAEREAEREAELLAEVTPVQ